MHAPARDAVPPGPAPLPIVGNALAFLRDKLGFLSACAAKYGDVVRLDIGGPTYLVSSPEDIKHVLIGNADNYEKSPRINGERARRFFGEGVVTALGPDHLRQRRMLQPVFHHSIIEQLAAVISAGTEKLLRHWDDGMSPDVHEEMLRLTQGVMYRALFGDTAADISHFAHAISVRRRYQEYLLESVLPFPELVPGRLGRDLAKAEREIRGCLDVEIARRRGAPGTSTDLLSMLVSARYDDGSGMSNELIRDEARTLALASYETLAEALTWTWYLLARSPDAESKLVAEVTVGRVSQGFGVADLRTLPYTRMVLAESMRLFPPTWLFVRVAQRDDRLPSGSTIAAGTKVYLSQWVTHRHPRYFSDPDTFDPLRFSDEAIRARPRYTYFPFGAGRRLCIGEEFAWMTGVLLLASIARRFRLVLGSGQTAVPEPNVTLRPRGGLRMLVRRR